MEDSISSYYSSEFHSSNTNTSLIDYVDWFETLSDEDIIEIEDITYEFIGDYIINEIHTMSSPYFHENMKKSIFLLLEELLLETQIYSKENEEELKSLIDQLCDQFFIIHNNIPPRSNNNITYHNVLSNEEKNEITQKIEKLKNVVQPKQKSEEWYKLRNEILTASNIWKVFASEAQQNSLIYEKCSQNKDFYHNTNINSSLHWGNKYEPLSLMVYQNITNTRVHEFGCIIHEKYPFMGASPDGIIVESNNNKYGRMIEIKNIVNREITGIPKEEYWIQMQIQMETCDLEECDFVETRFKEFDNEEDFYASDEIRGVILYFIHNQSSNNMPHYEYMDLDIPIEKENIDLWIQNKKDELKDTHLLFEIQYWYLDEISIVLVQRNREWFQSVIPKIEQFWKTIEKEKVEGFEHRNSKKKLLKTDFVEVLNDENSTNKIIHNMKNNQNICLIKLEDYEEKE